MAEHIFRRTGRYYYRRRYPAAVAAIIGKSEFVKALGTADPAEAARLSRQVGVKFDAACADALLRLVKTAPETSPPPNRPEDIANDKDVAKRVLDGLPEIIARITNSVIAEQALNKDGWAYTVDWQRRALQAHVDGQMPANIAMHPLEARTALDALEAAARGEPLSYCQDANNSSHNGQSRAATPTSAPMGQLDAKLFRAAHADYAIGKSTRRAAMAERLASRMLSFPCDRTAAVASISKWCHDELSKDKSPSSVRTEASAVVALLKYVPGWHDFDLPKVGLLKKLKGAGRARADARAPMSLAQLHDVLRALPRHLPRNGGYWHATLLLCALYGFRPGELLQAGQEALQERTDVFDGVSLVFQVGLNGAKNSASKRALPVPHELRPLFELALSTGSCNSETARTRVERLNQLTKKALGAQKAELSLYSVRHLFADVARSCNYTEEQFGPVMGHSKSASITRVYGGKAPLDFQAEVLMAVRHKLFPNGLTEFWPSDIGCI